MGLTTVDNAGDGEGGAELEEVSSVFEVEGEEVSVEVEVTSEE